MKTVLGIDNGTQSTKVIIYDYESKKILSETSAKHEIISRSDGTKEQKAEWWISALKECMNNTDSELKKTVVAIGVSGQQHGFVPLDSTGNVLYNVKLWCDTSTAQECKEIMNNCGGEEKLLDQVGNIILPGYTVSKILWLKKNHPQLYQQLDKILLPHDYLNYYLTGAFTMEYGDASGTGCLDIRKRAWSKDVLAAIDSERDLSSVLPNLISAEQVSGYLKGDIAKEFGLMEGIPVSSGGGDNMMGAIGTGAVKAGCLTMSLGTSGTLFGYSDTPIVEKSLGAFCSSTNGWLPLLCTMNCTISLELTKNLLEIKIQDVEDIVSKVPIGSDGIIILPFFNGERSPNLPRGKGCIMGLNLNNMTKGNLLRSSMESAVFGMKFGLDLFRKVGYENATEIRLTGGGSKSPTWRQIVADVFNLPVVVPQIQEAAAFGAAMQALWCYLNIDNLKKAAKKVTIEQLTNEHVMLDETKRHIPNMDAMVKYEAVYSDYIKYLDALYHIFE